MRVRACVGVLAFLSACATERERASFSGQDGGPDGPERRRLRSLTLCPVADLSDTNGGAGAPVSVSDVNVCVDRARPVGGTWESWDDFGGTRPCATSVAGEKVVLEGVPELSELIVTLRSAGYVSSALPALTGPGDTDTTQGRLGCGTLPIYRSGALTWLDPGVEPPNEQGIIAGEVSGLVLGGGSYTGGSLYGADLSINRIDGPPTSGSGTGGAGPFFSFNGNFCPDASSTLAPTDSELQMSSPDAAPPSFPGLTGFSFARLDEGEYEIEAAHGGAFCRTEGAFTQSVWGFPSASSGVVAPALPGHVTFVDLLCNCYQTGTGTIDPRTCSTEGVAVRPCGPALP